MNIFPQPLQSLITELGKLPGIGPKSAQRLAFFLLKRKDRDNIALSEAITEAITHLTDCPICFHIAEEGSCAICSDNNRDRSLICVVETPGDVIPIENSGAFKGLYHILGGVLSPMDGIGPNQLHIKELLTRVENDGIKEVILATGSGVEGEATASYLGDILKTKNVMVTRIAQGMPVGGNLEYIDEITISRALRDRKEI